MCLYQRRTVSGHACTKEGQWAVILYQGRTVSGHPVPRKDSERSCIYVLGVSVLPLSVFFLVDFGTVSTVKHFFFIVLSITLLYRLDFSHLFVLSILMFNYWKKKLFRIPYSKPLSLNCYLTAVFTLIFFHKFDIFIYKQTIVMPCKNCLVLNIYVDISM